MNKITEQMWEKAFAHLREYIEKAKKDWYFKPTFASYMYISMLEDRIEQGERTQKLYDEIMELNK